VVRCQQSIEMVVGVEFITMVNMLQLAAKNNRCIHLTKLHCLFQQTTCSLMCLHNISGVAGVHTRFLTHISSSPKESTYHSSVKSGTKYTTIAGAGRCSLV
jgi:hypothetical protein